MTEHAEQPPPGDRSSGYRSRTALIFAVAEIVGKLASFGMFAVASRVLGPDGFGEFSWALGIGLMVASFGMFGFDMALIQLGGANPAKVSVYLTSSIALRVGIAVVGVAVLAAWPFASAGSRETLLLMAVALSLENISMSVRAAAGVLDRQRGAAITIIIQRVAIAAISIGVLLAGGGVVGMAAAYLTGTAVGTASMLVVAHQIGASAHLRFLTWRDTKALTIKAILPGLANTMNMQTTRVDVIALARGGTYTNVGFFSSAYKLIETSLFLSDSLIRAAMPAMLYAREPSEVGRIIRAFFSTAAIFYVPFITVLIVRGADVLSLVFGAEYAAGSDALIALCWGLLALVTLSVLTTALLVTNHSADVAVSAFVTMVIKLIIVWPLVTTWGALGAGIAVALAFTVQAILLWWRLAHHGGRPRLGWSLVPAGLGGIAMIAPLLLDWALLPSTVVAGMCFLAVWLFTARHLDPEAITRVRSLVSK